MADVSDQTTTRLQRWLDCLRAGDDSARTELIAAAARRLIRLTRKMLRHDRRVKRWEETDDVSQNATLRLYRALAEVQPPSVRDFFRLAAVQIRRELIDLARHYYGPEGAGAKHGTQAKAGSKRDAAQPTYEPPDSIRISAEGNRDDHEIAGTSAAPRSRHRRAENRRKRRRRTASALRRTHGRRQERGVFAGQAARALRRR